MESVNNKDQLYLHFKCPPQWPNLIYTLNLTSPLNFLVTYSSASILGFISSFFLTIVWFQGPCSNNAFIWMRLGKAHPASHIGPAIESTSAHGQLMIFTISTTFIQNLNSKPILLYSPIYYMSIIYNLSLKKT